MQKILRLYSIRDQILSKATPPFAVEDEVEARRIFASHVKNLDRKLYENVFRLCEVGTFDVENCRINASPSAVCVAKNNWEYYKYLDSVQNGIFILKDENQKKEIQEAE